MHVTAPSAQQLRGMLPDVALRADKAELLRQLRPLHLDIHPSDPDDRICVQLRNGFTLCLTAGVLDTAVAAAWVRTQPVAHVQSHDLQTLLALAANGGQPYRIAEVAVFVAFARLVPPAGVEAPVAHHFVESPYAVTLLDDALAWSRASTGLPLQWEHCDGAESASGGNSGNSAVASGHQRADNPMGEQ